jgi:hypothetical protein
MPNRADCPTAGEARAHIKWNLPLMTWSDTGTIPQRQLLYGHRYERGVLAATIADGGIGKNIRRGVRLIC